MTKKGNVILNFLNPFLKEMLLWLLLAILAIILAIPLVLMEHQLTWEDLLAPPAVSKISTPVMPLALPVRTMPLKTELAALSPSPGLLAEVSGKSRSLSFDAASSKYNDMIEKTALKHKVSPLLVKAVIQAESNFNPQAVSHNGAVGLMQLMPATGRAMGVSDLKNPEQNIKAGVKYLKWLLTLYNNDEKMAIAAYNCGPDVMRRFNNEIPPYRETRAYVEKVMAYYSHFLES